jgi:hypothetical protein
MGCSFDLDVAAPDGGPLHVPADKWLSHSSLETPWHGFVWMNPPFGARNGLTPWLTKFYAHGNGVALVPDRTSAPWWQEMAFVADALLFVNGKVKFIRPDLSTGDSPSTGTVLVAAGNKGVEALLNAERAELGLCFSRRKAA